MNKKRIAFGVVSFIALIVWWGLRPYTGTIQYGVCKTFVELRINYPLTVRVSLIQNFDQALRIYYTYTDAYGQDRSDFIECTFRPDPVTGFAVDGIMINRIPIAQDEVDKFNETIPGILKYPPDLVLPKQEDILKNITIDPSAGSSIF